MSKKFFSPLCSSLGGLSVALLSVIGFAACSNDSIYADQPSTAQKDEVRYLRVAISNPPGTRDDKFVLGEDEDKDKDKDKENLVKDLSFRFYDATGKLLTSVTTEDIEKDEDGNIPFGGVTPPEGQTAGSISNGKIKEVVLKISLEKGAPYPAYVMCFINPVDYDNNTSVSMYDLRTKTVADYRGLNNCFAMNNSVYFGNDPISGANNVKMTGAPITAGQLYVTKDEAEDDGAKAVEVYVERYAAKVNFKLSNAEGAIRDYNTTNNTPLTLTFVPEFWTVNADAPNMYCVKSFENGDEASQIMTYNDVCSMLGNWAGTSWNDADNHRCYWACSPSFYATEFPQVSDDIIEKAKESNSTATGAGELVGNYKLRYYSYNQIASSTSTSDGKGVGIASEGGYNSKYVLENTMGQDAFNSLNPKAAAPSVLILGHYVIKNDETVISANDGFCMYGDKLYYRNSVPANAPEGSLTILDELLNSTQVLAKDENGTLITSGNIQTAAKALFEVVHPNKAVRGNQAVPHRYVTLQIKSNLTNTEATALSGLFYKPVGSDKWVSLETGYKAATDKQEFINGINLILWQQLGVCRAYTNNKAYFSIPIQHLGYTENTVNPPLTNGQLDWTKVRVGDFGLVRNHVYTIEVDGIQGLASGIADLNNPLVPSMDANDYWVKYKVNILKWRIVPTQGGIILK